MQGLLRSHVTCPECKLSSVTFDPYTSLSLPLPVDKNAVVSESEDVFLNLFAASCTGLLSCPCVESLQGRLW